MPLEKMEHYLVLTHDIENTRDFYQNILGLESGFRPDLGFPGYWCYLGTTPVIHIAEWETYRTHSRHLGIPVTSPAESTGSFDHIAFNGHDGLSMMKKLNDMKVPYSVNEVPAAALTQIFLDDPNGIKIELNFR